MRIRATTILKYRGVHDEELVATRLEIDWDDNDIWLDMSGLKRYEQPEWQLLLSLMTLGARHASVSFEHRTLL